MGDTSDTGNMEEELDVCNDDPVEQKNKSPRAPTPGESISTSQNPTSFNNHEKSSGIQHKSELLGMMESTVKQSPMSPVSSKGSSRRGRKQRNGHPEIMNGYSSPECASVVSVDAALSKEGNSYSSRRGKKRRYKANSKTLPVDSDSWTVGKAQEDEYIVENIVGKKFIETEDGKLLHYHIKWKGWGPTHNTWEPLANLEGCQEMVDRYESSRQTKRDNGVDSDDSDGERIIDHDQKDDFKKELLECIVDVKWPTHLIPLEVYGVIEVDKHMCYVVRHKAPKYTEKLTPENCVVVRASGFRKLFPHIIISFYESNILWVQRNETKEQLAKKAQKALETSGRKIKKKASRKRKKKTIIKVKTEPMDEPMEFDYESMDNMNNGIKHEIDENNEDGALDDDGLPIISFKGDGDVFGRLVKEELSDSTSDSEDDLEEIDDLFVLKTKSRPIV